MEIIYLMIFVIFSMKVSSKVEGGGEDSWVYKIFRKKFDWIIAERFTSFGAKTFYSQWKKNLLNSRHLNHFQPTGLQFRRGWEASLTFNYRIKFIYSLFRWEKTKKNVYHTLNAETGQKLPCPSRPYLTTKRL